jgi:hypothetical protein
LFVLEVAAVAEELPQEAVAEVVVVLVGKIIFQLLRV